MGNTYIEDLLDQVQRDKTAAQQTHPAHAEPDGDEEGRNKDKGKDDDGQGKPSPEKQASTPTPGDILAELQNLPEAVKAACAARAVTRLEAARAERTLIHGIGQPKQAAQQPGLSEAQERQIFDGAYSDQIEKYAAADPEFAQILLDEQIKVAFNQGYADELAQAGQGRQ